MTVTSRTAPTQTKPHESAKFQSTAPASPSGNSPEARLTTSNTISIRTGRVAVSECRAIVPWSRALLWRSNVIRPNEALRQFLSTMHLHQRLTTTQIRKQEFAQIRTMLASVTNARHRTRNRQIVDRARANVKYRRARLSPYLRANRDNGDGYPGGPLVQRLPTVAMGEPFPSPPFPMSLEALDLMTEMDINALSMLMGQDFLIAPSDDARTRRSKLLAHLLHCV